MEIVNELLCHETEFTVNSECDSSFPYGLQYTQYVIADVLYVADQNRYCHGNCFLHCLKVCKITTASRADNFDSL